MSIQYYHAQFGRPLTLLTGTAAATVLAVFFLKGWHPALVVALVMLAVGWLLFWRLVVVVDEEQVQLRFGIGLIRRSFPLGEITNVEAVRTPWYSGWGIRRVRNGWLYKVAGRNALEVTLTSGERHLIGSDEPNRLGRAILRTRGHWTSGRVARTLREL